MSRNLGPILSLPGGYGHEPVHSGDVKKHTFLPYLFGNCAYLLSLSKRVNAMKPTGKNVSRKRFIQGALLLLLVVVLITGVFVVKGVLTHSKKYTLAWHFYNIGFPDISISLTPVQPARQLTSLGHSISLDFSVQKTWSSLKLDTTDPQYACLQGVTPLLYANQQAFPGRYLAVFDACGQLAQAPAAQAGRGQPQVAPHFAVMFTFERPPCSVYAGTRPGEQPNNSICFPSLNGTPGNTPSALFQWDLENAAYVNQIIPLTPIKAPRPLSSFSHLVGVNLYVGRLTFESTDPAYQCDVGVPPLLFEDQVAYPALFIVAYHLCAQGKTSSGAKLYGVFTFATPPCSVDDYGKELCFFFKEVPAQQTGG